MTYVGQAHLGTAVDGCGNDTIELEPTTGDYYVTNAQIQDEGGSLTLVLKAGDTEIDSTTTQAHTALRLYRERQDR